MIFGDAEADFDNLVDGDLEVAQNEEATVSGTTNVAPGSELTVRIRRTGDHPFLESQTTTVAEDVSVEVTFDTSQIAVETTFTATIRQGGKPISDETDGVIVEQVDTETETETETETDEPPETTETDGQPGFGVAIAIVTLLGAALLALRRRD